ncbi:MAG: DNA gyrase/topoisomerase IV subunit A [Flavobacteriales bacterium]
MSDEIDNINEENENLNSGENFPQENNPEEGEKLIPMSGMYESWFLDYASYVILERAVPALEDGLKPVQRRILHSMKELDDGRYNKVANIIGNTMKYHPHGDASIGDAMVQIGQKEIIIDTQGNWGNVLTGDGAAAPRYIEARLTKFANHVAFNAKTTKWLASYDGRNKEPIHLPMKFPLLLAQGAEGIAVGLACKILPHNFIELIDASIEILRGKKPQIVPDFPNGGMVDVSNYNDGLRGGKIRVRAKIRKDGNKAIVIHEIPFGTTTDSLIESVIKANDKGKIKIKKIDDNTAAEAEIIVHLAPGVSPDQTIDALYAFTDCEISISPNSCVIFDDKPVFMPVSEILQNNTQRTMDLLRWELEIKLAELEEQWHFSSLEKIFIENRIYRDIEDQETWEGVIDAIDKGLKPHTKHLKRVVTEDDIIRLTEIKIKRISKFDSFKADEEIRKLEENIELVKVDLANIVNYTIAYFKDLKEKYGKGRERRSEIRVFDTIQAQTVIVANKKLYVDAEEGFIGWGIKKAEHIAECSEIDDIIIFFDTGKMMVTKIAEKKFVGKGIIYANVWKKGDKRTIYHMIYQDGTTGLAMMKRFAVTSITRDKEYDLTRGTKGSKAHYLSANPNGLRETVTVNLRPRPHLKRTKLEVDFGELLIKGMKSAGNRVTKEIVSKVIQKEVGDPTLGARKIWYDEVVGRLNDEGRGRLLGSFKGEDRILTIYQNGTYKLSGFDLSTHFDEGLLMIEKWYPERPIACVYFDAEKDMHFVKRFYAEVSSKEVKFISEGEGSELKVVSTAPNPKITLVYNKHLRETKTLPDKEHYLNELIEIKGVKAQGNQLTKLKLKEIILNSPAEAEEWPEEIIQPTILVTTEDDTVDYYRGEDDVPEDDEDENNNDKPPVRPKSGGENAEKPVAKDIPLEIIAPSETPISEIRKELIKDEEITIELDVKPSSATTQQNNRPNPIKPINDDPDGQISLF